MYWVEFLLVDTVSRGCKLSSCEAGVEEVIELKFNPYTRDGSLTSTAALATAGLPSRTLCDAGTLTYWVSVRVHGLPLSLKRKIWTPALCWVSSRKRTGSREEVNRRLLGAAAPGAGTPEGATSLPVPLH